MKSLSNFKPYLCLSASHVFLCKIPYAGAYVIWSEFRFLHRFSLHFASRQIIQYMILSEKKPLQIIHTHIIWNHNRRNSWHFFPIMQLKSISNATLNYGNAREKWNERAEAREKTSEMAKRIEPVRVVKWAHIVCETCARRDISLWRQRIRRREITNYYSINSRFDSARAFIVAAFRFHL